MRIWGFDLGTTSIGFAVVDYDPARIRLVAFIDSVFAYFQRASQKTKRSRATKHGAQSG